MKFVVFSGGVGGAKFADGIVRAVGGENLTVIVNVGDDFELYGMPISPDIDTVVYTLAGVANPTTGWGLEGETWNNFERLVALEAKPWFRLGDKDLATHLLRTQQRRSGATLSHTTQDLARRLGVTARVLPVTDDRLRTMVETDNGMLEFQDYFVRHQCEPKVRGLTFIGSEEARPNGAAVAAIEEADCIVFGPSNPFLSLEPMLAMPIVKDALFSASAPIIAVTPIIAGEAVKGPAAKLMRELNLDPSAVTVAKHYSDVINGFVLDSQDAHLKAEIEAMGIGVHVTDTLMRDRDDRARLACEVVNFADALRPNKLGGCKIV